MYPVVFFDALRVKIRDEGTVRNKAVYLALGAGGRREQGGAGPVDRTERRSQVLAESDERTAQPRRGGRADRSGRWAQRLSGSDHQRFSADAGADLHRASEPLLACRFAAGKSARPWLASSKRFTGPKPPRPPPSGSSEFEAGTWGKKYPMIGRELAAKLGAGHSLLRLSAGGAKNHLHDQRDRELAHAAAQGAQESGTFPERRSGDQAHLSGLAQHHQMVEKPTGDLEEAANQFAIQFGQRFNK